MAQFRFTEYGDLFHRAAVRGLNLAAEELRSRSIPKAPIQDGILRASAQVVPATEEHLQSAVTYDTPYAVVQHERLDFHHTEGQAKYLEQPLMEGAKDYVGIIAQQIRDVT